MPRGITDFAPAALVSARETAGLSLQQLAGLLGTRTARIAGWESGQHLPTSKTLARMARVLRVSVDDLRGRDPRRPFTVADQRYWLGLTQAEVANRAGLTQHAYADLEHGAPLTEDVAHRVAAALRVTVEELRARHAAARAQHERR